MYDIKEVNNLLLSQAFLPVDLLLLVQGKEDGHKVIKCYMKLMRCLFLRHGCTLKNFFSFRFDLPMYLLFVYLFVSKVCLKSSLLVLVSPLDHGKSLKNVRRPFFLA